MYRYIQHYALVVARMWSPSVCVCVCVCGMASTPRTRAPTARCCTPDRWPPPAGGWCRRSRYWWWSDRSNARTSAAAPPTPSAAAGETRPEENTWETQRLSDWLSPELVKLLWNCICMKRYRNTPDLLKHEALQDRRSMWSATFVRNLLEFLPFCIHTD